MALCVSSALGSGSGLATPRESKVELSGYGVTKINQALMRGAKERQVRRRQ
jgi:hypothetical protein